MNGKYGIPLHYSTEKTCVFETRRHANAICFSDVACHNGREDSTPTCALLDVMKITKCKQIVFL